MSRRLFRLPSLYPPQNPFFDVMATCDDNAGWSPHEETQYDDYYYSDDAEADARKQCVKDLVIADKPGDPESEVNYEYFKVEPVDQGKNLTAEIANEWFVGVPYLLGTIDLNKQGPEYGRFFAVVAASCYWRCRCRRSPAPAPLALRSPPPPAF